MRDIALSSIALLFTALTTVLLVWDLEHKSRFLRVVFTPQKKSWLARGAFILIGYSALAGLYWIGAVFGVSTATALLLWPTLLIGILAAVYTAFLFGQCEGRDLWQTPLLPMHMIVQAFLCGAAVLVLLPDKLGGSADSLALARTGLICGLVGHLAIVGTEFLMPYRTDNAAYAAWLITHGPFKRMFWFGSVVAGGVVPLLVLVSMKSYLASAVASILALGGLLAFEWCFVMAGQSVPNS
jgi:formate-dependent nitrite reductase membrane component NrfD